MFRKVTPPWWPSLGATINVCKIIDVARVPGVACMNPSEMWEGLVKAGQ